MGLKNKINDTPEQIAKFWKFLRNKTYQIKEKNLQIAIKDDLENRINKLRSKVREHNFKASNFINLSLPKIETDYRFFPIFFFKSFFALRSICFQIFIFQSFSYFILKIY